MTNKIHTPYKRTLAALGTTAALAMALTGCLPGGNKDAAPAPTQQETAAAATTAASDRGANRTTQAPETTQAPAPAGNAGELTPPGTKLKFGEIANIHSNSGKKGDAKYKEATFESTVTKIVAGSPDDLSKLEGASKFAGQTPYYVYYESKLTSLSTPSAGMSDLSPDGHLKDGTEAQKLIVFGTLGDCKSGSFETEGKDDTFSYKVGSTKQSCSVFLAPAGDEVVSASYNDMNFSYESYSDNQYRKNPVTWGN